MRILCIGGPANFSFRMIRVGWPCQTIVRLDGTEYRLRKINTMLDGEPIKEHYVYLELHLMMPDAVDMIREAARNLVANRARHGAFFTAEERYFERRNVLQEPTP